MHGSQVHANGVAAVNPSTSKRPKKKCQLEGTPKTHFGLVEDCGHRCHDHFATLDGILHLRQATNHELNSTYKSAGTHIHARARGHEGIEQRRGEMAWIRSNNAMANINGNKHGMETSGTLGGRVSVRARVAVRARARGCVCAHARRAECCCVERQTDSRTHARPTARQAVAADSAIPPVQRLSSVWQRSKTLREAA